MHVDSKDGEQTNKSATKPSSKNPRSKAARTHNEPQNLVWNYNCNLCRGVVAQAAFSRQDSKRFHRGRQVLANSNGDDGSACSACWDREPSNGEWSARWHC